MAIEIKANQVEQPDTIKRRTFKVVIDSPMSEAPEIVLSREIVPFKNGVQIVGGSEFQIAREFSKVQDETIAMAGGFVLTVAQVAQAIALFGDKWDREDNGL
jgi:hypothetical protein